MREENSLPLATSSAMAFKEPINNSSPLYWLLVTNSSSPQLWLLNSAVWICPTQQYHNANRDRANYSSTCWVFTGEWLWRCWGWGIWMSQVVKRLDLNSASSHEFIWNQFAQHKLHNNQNSILKHIDLSSQLWIIILYTCLMTWDKEAHIGRKHTHDHISKM